MAPNARVVKWLISMYRNVLHRQWIDQRLESGEFVARRVGRGSGKVQRPHQIEPLEQRVLLSAENILPGITDYTTNPRVTTDEKTAIIDGVTALRDRLVSLVDSNQFHTDVPGVLAYTGSFPFKVNPLDLASVLGAEDGSVFTDLITNQILDHINNVPVNTFITGLNFTASDTINVGTILDPKDVTYAVSISNPALNSLGGIHYSLTFDVNLSVTTDAGDNLYFDLGRNEDAYGIRPLVANEYQPAFSNNIAVTGGMAVKFSGGLNVDVTTGEFDNNTSNGDDTKVVAASGSSTWHDDFFVTGGDLSATASADTTGETHTAGAMQFGFLNVTMDLKKYKLDGTITQKLANEGTVTYADIGSISASAGATSGSITSDVVISVVDSGSHFHNDFDAPPKDYEIHFTGAPFGSEIDAITGSGDPRTAPHLKLSDDAKDVLVPFSNLTPGAIVGGIKALADKLGSLSASSVLTIPVPLAKNITLGQIFPLGDIIDNALIYDQLNKQNKLVDDKGNALFDTAQTLASKLASILGKPISDINPTYLDTENGSASHKLLFSVAIDDAFDPKAIANMSANAIDLSLDLGKIAGLDSHATVDITPTGSIKFTFGVDLADTTTAPIQITPQLLDPPQLRAVLDGSGAAHTPSNGQLTNDAAFRLTVGGSSGGTADVLVTVADASADGSVSDLVTLLQNKIDAAFTKNLINPQPKAGHHLVTVSTLADGRLVLTSEYSTFLTIRKLSTTNFMDAGGYVNNLGFIDSAIGQAASTAPAPANGILSGDATFDLLIGTAASPVTVTVTQASTLDNQSTADLVADINAALATAGVDTKVVAQLLSGSPSTIVLKAKDGADVHMLQVLNPNAVALLNLGWQDRQISAEIAATGEDAFVVQADAQAPANGKPGTDVTFNVTIKGETVPVTVLVTKAGNDTQNDNQSNTGDNNSVSDLASDINLALFNAKLSTGQRLGELLAADAIDTDHDTGASATASAFTPDTILFRSTAASVTGFTIAPITGGSAIGLNNSQNASLVGPLTTAGVVPTGDAKLVLTVGDGTPATITVKHTDTTDNSLAADPIAALVADVQKAVNDAGLTGQVIVGRAGGQLVLTTPDTSVQTLRVSLSDTDTLSKMNAATVLGYEDGQVARVGTGLGFFVQDASATLKLHVTATNATANANIGFVGITINDIDADLNDNLVIKLQDNANSGASRIFLNNLDSTLTDITFTSDTALPANGQLGGDATFDVTIDGTVYHVSVPASDPDGNGPLTGTDTNNTAGDLVIDVQNALDVALHGTDKHVTATLDKTGKLVLSITALEAKSFTIDNLGGTAVSGLKLSTHTGYSFLDHSAASWTGSLKFGDVEIPNAPAGLDSIPAFDVNVSVGDGLTGFASLTPDLSILNSAAPQLLDFVNLLFSSGSGNDVLGVIDSLATFLKSKFPDLPFISTQIPLINKSLADLLGLSDTFSKIADAFAGNPANTVQQLENRLIEALSLPSNDPDNLVNVSFDSATHTLFLKLGFNKSFNESLPIDFNLNLPFEIKGNAALSVEGGVLASLTVGLDLSDPSSPKLFLDTKQSDTGFKLTFGARGSDLNFDASFGPLGLKIIDGQLAIDTDGLAGTDDPIAFSAYLQDNDGTADNRVSFSDLGNVGVTSSTFTGAINATLPIFFPTDSDFLCDLTLQITDLNAFIHGDTSVLHVGPTDLSDIANKLLADAANFNILDNIPMMLQGVDFVFAKLQDLLNGKFGSMNLPLVGNGIHDAVQFIQNIRTNVLQGLEDKINKALDKGADTITQAITDVFTGLGLLKSAVTADTSHLHDGSNSSVQWTFDIGQHDDIFVPFNLGLPVLGLKSTSPMDIGLDWTIHLGFGLDFQHGFFFVINDAPNTPEVTATLSLGLPSIEGNLLFFKITGEDRHPGPDLVAQLGLDLTESSDSDNKVTIAELPDITPTFTLAGSANIDIHLTAGIGGGGSVDNQVIAAIPKIVADFKLRATLNLSSASDANNDSPFDLTYVAMEHVGLDLGSFFTDFLKPVVQGIQDVTKPIQPLIDVFTSPIPVISDLAGQPITLLDIAAFFGDVDPGMLDAIANIITLVNSIPTDIGDGDLILPFGDVVLVDTEPGAPSGGTDFNLFDEHALDAVKDPNTPLSSLGHFGSELGGNLSSALSGATNDAGDPESVPDTAASFVNGLDNHNFGDFIDFPFLHNPSQILGALFGRPFTIVTLDLPAFTFSFSYSQFFPIVGPLGASITGTLGASFKFAFGYDSYGLQKFAQGGFEHPLDLFAGFYISDTANADGTGPDVNEIEITGSLVGSAELNLGVASASVGGGVKVTFGLNLHDPNNDGKVRIEELIDDILYSDPGPDPLGIFDLEIKVEAFLTWAVEILFVFKASGQIGPSLPLLDLHFDQQPKPVLASNVDTIPGHPDENILRLNTGPFAKDRQNQNTTDGDENYTITEIGDHKVQVTGFGVDETFDNVYQIEGQGGQGNDTFTFINTGGYAAIPINIDGGAGDDTIDASQWNGNANLTGGSGNDKLFGGSGNDVIDGGAGNDLIVGGGGNDWMTGDDGNDTISGDGNDVIFGGAGDDKLAGGPDDDYISGGDGNDEIWGDATFGTDGTFTAATGISDGNDWLSGDAGDDIVHGDGGNDHIGGGGGNDLLEGDLGSDTIYGDSTYTYNATSGTFDVSLIGNDTNHAGTVTSPLPQTSGNDRIYGENEGAALTGASSDGGDFLYGEDGNDFMRGNGGNDYMEGGTGADIMFGDQGNDEMHGGADGDIMFGGADNDKVFGETGSDVLFGDDGIVVYFGFPNFSGYQGNQMVGSDRVIGDGTNPIPSASGFDTDSTSRDYIATDVMSTDGNDQVDGAAGNDIAFGGGGNDTVTGDDNPSDGIDPKTPTGDDLLFGDGGEVMLNTRVYSQADTIPSAFDGTDSMYGNNGNDIMFGGGGGDTMYGGHGGITPTTASDNDIMIGDNGEVDFTLGVRTKVFSNNPDKGGSDVMGGDEGDDIMIGGAAGDTISGNTGNDVMIGDEGEVDFIMPDTTTKATYVSVIKTTDGNELNGGVDTISGSTGNDVILGGVQGDILNGNEDKDIVLGDEGQLDYNLGGSFDGDKTTLDRIMTTSFTLGGNDTITGDADNDVLIGGSKDDSINGGTGNDIAIGDQGEVDYKNTLVTRIITTDTVPADGGIDTINGNDGTDIIMGGVAGDILNGNNGDDIILGDEGQVQYNLSGGLNQDGDPATIDNIETLQPTLGGNDTIQGNAGNDIVFGGKGNDSVYGDAKLFADLNAAADGNDILFGDGGRISETGGIIWKIESTDTSSPGNGNDYIEGNAGNDIMVGGSGADEMHGDSGVAANINAAADGNDIMLGDNGMLNWLYQGDPSLANGIENSLVFDATIGTLDIITTIAPNDGGNDIMFGNAGSDDIFGGTGSDLVVGDDTKVSTNGVVSYVGTPSARPGSDLEFGDHGRLYPTNSYLRNNFGIPLESRNFFSIDTGFGASGAGDVMFGNEQDDMMLGGQGNDQMFGNAGDDDMIGGHNVSGGIDSLVAPIAGSTTNDYMDGGSGNDAMAGDNAVIWRNASPILANDLRLRDRALAHTQIYGQGVNVNGSASGYVDVTGVGQNDPLVSTTRTVFLYDHDKNIEPAALTSATGSFYGNDVMAGGGDNDAMFGQLGADLMMGDGSITPTTLVVAHPEASTDGDDYIEGNGGSDTIYGGLGQDDIIGGSSDLFGLTLASQRPDVNDLIYGGAGTEIARNDLGNQNANGHARDSDMILGDNGDIFRIVGTNGVSSGNYLSFNYDNYTNALPVGQQLKIVVRAANLLDYTPGGIDYNPAKAATDIGAADEIHGEGGDDFIWGMKGSDALYGEGQDDDIYGGYGNDWISGGTGQDGILGDDGLFFTSRNGLSEPLYGIAAIPAAQLNLTITTPGKIQTAVINVSGALKKAVDLTPFSSDPTWNGLTDEFTTPGSTPQSVTHANEDDIIFGGLGDDFIHGGTGDDAISGGEALPESYGQLYDANNNLIGIVRIDYTHPFNPGDELRFNPVDPNDAHHDKRHRAGEFALYDENDPMRQIQLNADGTANKTNTGKLWFLDFNQGEGPADTKWDPAGSGKATDGDDVIFGDNGNDWINGGTGRDDMFGGWGNDLLNADDDQTTNGGLNNTTDTAASYEDRAFGGAGKDVLIGNTGGDRLIDWVGEFNSYLVPFAPFGMATVSRTVQPQLPEFLYALSASDGADFTRAADIPGSDPLRNGEPYGELGEIDQKDHAQWHDQTGAPTDPQAGNTPGSKRDVLRTDSLSSGAAQAFFVDSGSWSTAGNAYTGNSAAITNNSDAISLFDIDTWLHTYYEVLATMKLSTTAGNGKQVGFIIFDYQSPTDFKYAGLDAINDVLKIGRRTPAGWIDVATLPAKLQANTVYSPMLTVNGATATLTLGANGNNTYSLSANFTDQLNDGMTGLGTYGGNCNFLSITVQQLPINFVYSVSEDFSDGVANGFVASAGTWTTTSGSAGRYSASPVAGVAISTKPFVVAPLSYVEYSATVRANTNGTIAGLVYAYTDANNFLYAGIVAGTNQVVLGHCVGGVFTNDLVATATIAANTDYTLLVSLTKNNVSAVLNGVTVASYTYNILPNQGRLGLFTKGGAGSFDNLLIRGDDVTFTTTPQLLSAASVPAVSSTATLQTWQLAPIVDAAYDNWARALGTSSSALKAKISLTFAVSDLSGSELGSLSGTSVLIDSNAAGNGWFIDGTPRNNAEYRRKAGVYVAKTGPASQGIDLLTVVMHEMGHALGLPDEGTVMSSLMYDTLGIGQRKLPGQYVNVLSLLQK